MKRRIEITRERWTRWQIQSSNELSCAGCGAVSGIMALPHAAAAVDPVERAVQTGLPVSCDASGRQFICADCLWRLFRMKQAPGNCT